MEAAHILHRGLGPLLGGKEVGACGDVVWGRETLFCNGGSFNEE